ncbi:MAG: hypothetical protein AAGA48_06810 [Myxococcota bacterium]
MLCLAFLFVSFLLIAWGMHELSLRSEQVYRHLSRAVQSAHAFDEWMVAIPAHDRALDMSQVARWALVIVGLWPFWCIVGGFFLFVPLVVMFSGAQGAYFAPAGLGFIGLWPILATTWLLNHSHARRLVWRRLVVNHQGIRIERIKANVRTVKPSDIRAAPPVEVELHAQWHELSRIVVENGAYLCLTVFEGTRQFGPLPHAVLKQLVDEAVIRRRAEDEGKKAELGPLHDLMKRSQASQETA